MIKTESDTLLIRPENPEGLTEARTIVNTDEKKMNGCGWACATQRQKLKRKQFHLKMCKLRGG